MSHGGDYRGGTGPQRARLGAALVVLALTGAILSVLPNLYMPSQAAGAGGVVAVVASWGVILAAWLLVVARSGGSAQRLWFAPSGLFRASVVVGPLTLLVTNALDAFVEPSDWYGGRPIATVVEALSYECAIVVLASLAAFAITRTILRPAREMSEAPAGARDLRLRMRYIVAAAGSSFATAGVLLAVLLDFPKTPTNQLLGFIGIALLLVGFSASIGWLVGNDAARNVEFLTRRVHELAARAEAVVGHVPVLSRDEVGDLAMALRELEQRIRRDEAFAASTAERERLARELHDGAAKAVSALGLEAASLRAKATDEGTLRQLDRMEKLARDLSEEIRAILRDLRSRSDPLPFSSVLESCVASTLPTARLDLGPGVEDASPLIRYRFMRILAEALHNAATHAHASTVAVRVARDDGRIRMTVEDDGVGIDAIEWDRLVADGHFGLVGMRERARLLGGDLGIERNIPRGTRIVVEVPMRGEE